MKQIPVNLNDAWQKEYLQKEGFQYAWIMSIGAVILKPIDTVELPQIDEVLEARFFSKKKELHVFQYEDEYRCVMTITEDTDTLYTEEEQKLRKRFGRSIIMRRFITHDEDGLASFGTTVLCGADLGGRQ
ncbi:MAG: hypothetical protein IKS37_08580 [Solobacterium sp.]|nr:hypothetical protein [Solobacterium sp.]